jgi:hypothetical protein
MKQYRHESKKRAIKRFNLICLPLYGIAWEEKSQKENYFSQ